MSTYLLFFQRQSLNPTTVLQEMTQELVIPLVQEMEFYNMLTTTLESASLHLTAVQSDFMFSLRNLSDIISDSVHPASTASTFRPYSPLTANAGSVRVKTSKLKVIFSCFFRVSRPTIDLYWRVTYILGGSYSNFISKPKYLRVSEKAQGVREV